MRYLNICAWLIDSRHFYSADSWLRIHVSKANSNAKKINSFAIYLATVIYLLFCPFSTVMFVLRQKYGDSKSDGPIGEGEQESTKRQSAVVQAPLPGQIQTVKGKYLKKSHLQNAKKVSHTWFNVISFPALPGRHNKALLRNVVMINIWKCDVQRRGLATRHCKILTSDAKCLQMQR